MIPELSDIEQVYFPLFTGDPGNMATMPLLLVWADYNNIRVLKGPTLPAMQPASALAMLNKKVGPLWTTMFYGACNPETYKRVFGREYDILKMGPEIQIVQEELKQLAEREKS